MIVGGIGMFRCVAKSIAAGILLAVFSMLPAQAATIEHLAKNPVSQDRSAYRLLNLTDPYADGIGFQLGLENSPSATTNASKSALIEGWSWVFKGGIQSDGAHTYQSLHMPAAWGSLRVGKVIEITGQIERGDLGKLQKLVEDTGFSECFRPGYCPFNNIISLNSPGGNFVEAIRIAKYIAEHNFVTLLARNAVCESACAMIFLGGYTKYEGFFFPRRFAHETASLGVHQPFIGVPEGTYSADQVGQVAKVVNKGVNAATQHLLSVGAGIGLLRNMYATAPTSMYRLSVLEMSEQGIFVLGENRDAEDFSRTDALAYCAGRYQARYFEVVPALLDNLQTDQRTFLTYIPGQNFVCMGVKAASTGKWSVSTCMASTCWFAKYGQNEIGKYTKEKDFEDLMGIAVGIDNAEMGIAIKSFRHRTVLLKYIRLFATDSAGSFRKLTAIEANLPMPKAFCGRIDASDAGLVRKVQTALNQAGINVGRPDGSPGPGTRKGVRAANLKLLNRKTDQIDAALLRALGLSQDVVADYTVCGG